MPIPPIFSISDSLGVLGVRGFDPAYSVQSNRIAYTVRTCGHPFLMQKGYPLVNCLQIFCEQVRVAASHF